ncbi:hypothetical protein HHK36_007796 [Tetracentron sinense]|uniref:Uncharacterized protein n=1 Tax=Tetracentron sinense TaxID=13715 RepID=A0A834ZED9_TETSI|nr:hypothetical protein HHK36_007796 [Tetracentron sinense]
MDFHLYAHGGRELVKLVYTSCNNKIVGAKFFVTGYEDSSKRSVDGHGEFRSPRDGSEHMALTPLQPQLELWWKMPIYVLAAIDKVDEDGVDVLSLSLGSTNHLYGDSILVATFTTIEKGIFVACATRNDSPDPYSVTNTAPTTVGAGTLDPTFPAQVLLGNDQAFLGDLRFTARRLI